jgi:hypothetical protein
MASKEEKERLAEELRQRAHPKFLGIGLEENLAKCVRGEHTHCHAAFCCCPSVCPCSCPLLTHGPPTTTHTSPPKRESLTNVKFIQTLLDVIGEAGADGGCPRTQGNLLYTVAIKVRDGLCGVV